MRNALLVLAVPPLFVLCLWLAFLTGDWWAGLTGDTSGYSAAMTGFFGFCIYAASFGFALHFACEAIGKKK